MKKRKTPGADVRGRERGRLGDAGIGVATPSMVASLLLLAALLVNTAGCSGKIDTIDSKPAACSTRLYWFIPDGTRADPDLFRFFEWAEDGTLPNIGKLMDMGARGYSIPTFPSHTPTNFATLFTGSYPSVHGVADGPMHIEGKPLARPSLGGFSSTAKRVPPIWVTLEEAGEDVFLLSVPGSTPPELDMGTTVRGRWGGWGADFPALIWETTPGSRVRAEVGRGNRLFYVGPHLTNWVDPSPVDDATGLPEFRSILLRTSLEAYGASATAFIHDSTDDGIRNYDGISFFTADGEFLADLAEGEWSGWFPVTLEWGSSGLEVATSFRISVIRIEPDGSIRVRFFYNNLNRYIVKPPEAADMLLLLAGPMMDFVDNFPPQLFRYDEDEATFRNEAFMTLDWHKGAVCSILDEFSPDIFIHDTYTPNQVLTGRWYMGNIDPASRRYEAGSEKEKESWAVVLEMYKKLDDILGEAMARMGDDSYVVFSSDHGAVPLNRFVRLNNFFARRGLLSFTVDETTGEPSIEWEKTRAVYLKMDAVYVHPDGLGGDWTRGSGPEYEALRNHVAYLLENELADENGESPLDGIWKWEEAEACLDLPKDRVGDLILANVPGYGWFEEVSADLEVFFTPLKAGYKQAMRAEKIKGLWTPFIIAGPGVKAGYRIREPISHADQYPTIMKLLGVESPAFVQGRVIEEIFD